MKIGLLSNIHDNIHKLKDAIHILKREKSEFIVCLGDIVGSTVPHCLHYFDKRASSECIQMVSQFCDVSVIGNHDLNAIWKLPKYTADFKYPKNWFKLDYFTKKDESKGKIWLYENELPTLLGRKDRMFLIALPEIHFKNFDEDTLMFSHYAYPDPSGSTSITYRNPRYLRKHFKYMEVHNSKISFSGHEHVNGIQVFTPDDVFSVPFNEELKLNPKTLSWITGPAVCTHKDITYKEDIPNGVMVYDTKKMTIKAIMI